MSNPQLGSSDYDKKYILKKNIKRKKYLSHHNPKKIIIDV
jgi:hypothetical protein